MIHVPSAAFRHLAASLATVILAVGLVLGGTISEAPAAKAPTSASTFVSQTVKATNTYRKQVGKPQVSSSSCLTKYASAWAKTIAKKGKMVHRSTSSLKTILRKCGLRAIGENLAKGQKSGQSVVTAWSKSAPHRKNLVNQRYRKYGMASYWDGSRWWTVQLLAGK